MAYTFKIISDTQGAVTGLKSVKDGVRGVRAETEQTSASMQVLSTQMRDLRNYFLAYVGVRGILNIGKEIVDTTAKFEALTNVIKYASLTPKDALENIAYIEDAVKRLHLPLMETYEGFSQMQAGMIGTGIQGKVMRDVFEGLAVANSVLHLPTNAMSRIFYDVKVMAEMTTIQKRELGRMLARFLPGTMGLAAKTKDVDIEHFMEMLKAGEIKSKDFLPEFAKNVKDYYSKGLKYSTVSLVAAQNDFKTTMTYIFWTLGEKMKPLMLILYRYVINIGYAFKEWLKTSAAKDLGQALYDMLQILKGFLNTVTYLWPVLKYVVGLFLIWKALFFFDKWALGIQAMIIGLDAMFVSASSVGVAFQSWLAPLILSFGLLYLAADQLVNILEMLGNSSHIKDLAKDIDMLAGQEIALNSKKYQAEKKGNNDDVNTINKRLSEVIAERHIKEDEYSDLKNYHNPLNVWDRLSKRMGLNKLPGMIENPGGGGADFFKQGEGTGLKDAAINSSNLSGAGGGLGQAKVINFNFYKSLVENNLPGGNGMDVLAKSPQAAEMILRIFNNIASPQGATM